MNTREIRLSKKLTQHEFAKLLGVTKSAVEKWEYSNIQPSESTQKLIKLLFPQAKVLNQLPKAR
jgi:DNA-binding transcriptional regulator YiaG